MTVWVKDAQYAGNLGEDYAPIVISIGLAGHVLKKLFFPALEPSALARFKLYLVNSDSNVRPTQDEEKEAFNNNLFYATAKISEAHDGKFFLIASPGTVGEIDLRYNIFLSILGDPIFLHTLLLQEVVPLPATTWDGLCRQAKKTVCGKRTFSCTSMIVGVIATAIGILGYLHVMGTGTSSSSCAPVQVQGCVCPQYPQPNHTD